MRMLALALLRTFLADRTAAALSLLAPIAFFSLLAIFYHHLESPDGLRLPVLVIVPEGNQDAARLADALSSLATGPLDVVRADEHSVDSAPVRPIATVRVPSDFSAQHPELAIEGGIPLPGGLSGVRQLVELAHAKAFATTLPPMAMSIVDRPGRLLRESVAGIAFIFVMFSISSITSRGLALDAAGLRDRLRSIGSGGLTYMGARIAVLTGIAAAQIVLTLLWAWAAFGVRPMAPAALGAAAALSAFCMAAVFTLLAAVCRTRARFIAIAPLVTLVLSAISGSLIPGMLLPGWVTAAGNCLFPAWGISAIRDAIEGVWNVQAQLLLLGLAILSAIAASRLERKVLEP
jgi:hypothetical protein